MVLVRRLRGVDERTEELMRGGGRAWCRESVHRPAASWRRTGRRRHEPLVLGLLLPPQLGSDVRRSADDVAAPLMRRREVDVVRRTGALRAEDERVHMLPLRARVRYLRAPRVLLFVGVRDRVRRAAKERVADLGGARAVGRLCLQVAVLIVEEALGRPARRVRWQLVGDLNARARCPCSGRQRQRLRRGRLVGQLKGAQLRAARVRVAQPRRLLRHQDVGACYLVGPAECDLRVRVPVVDVRGRGIHVALEGKGRLPLVRLQRAAVLRKQLALVPARHAFGSSFCNKDVGGRTR